MADTENSEDEIELPPLKPQKNLFAFFGAKSKTKNGLKTVSKPKKKPVSKSDNEDENCTEEQSPLKPHNHKSKRKRRIVDDTDSDEVNESSKEDESKGKESNLHNKILQSRPSEEKKTLCTPLSTEMAKCDIPTPFPVTNHIQQGSYEVSSKLPLLQTGDEGENVDFKIGSLCYKELLNLDVLKTEKKNNDDVIEKPIADWLEELEEMYPDLDVKKMFQQFLVCQKKVILTDLKKLKASKLAVESIWNKQVKDDAAERLAKEQKEREEKLKEEQRLKEEELERRKEGKDIRKMFAGKSSKKKALRKKADPEKLKAEESIISDEDDFEEPSSGRKKDKGKKSANGGLKLSSGLFGSGSRRKKNKSDREMEKEEKEHSCEIEDENDEVLTRGTRRSSRRANKIQDDEAASIDVEIACVNDENASKYDEIVPIIDEEVPEEKLQPVKRDCKNIKHMFLKQRKTSKKSEKKNFNETDIPEKTTPGKNVKFGSQPDPKNVTEDLDVVVVDKEIKASKVNVESSKLEVESSKLDVESSKLDVEFSKLDVETSKLDVETAKLDVETAKLDVETAKLDVETSKLDVENANENAELDESPSQTRRKRKSKKGLDFLKIKYVGNNNENKEEDLKQTKVVSKDIRSMFSQVKQETDQLVKIKSPVEKMKFDTEELDSKDTLNEVEEVLGNTEMEIEIKVEHDERKDSIDVVRSEIMVKGEDIARDEIEKIEHKKLGKSKSSKSDITNYFTNLKSNKNVKTELVQDVEVADNVVLKTKETVSRDENFTDKASNHETGKKEIISENKIENIDSINDKVPNTIENNFKNETKPCIVSIEKVEVPQNEQTQQEPSFECSNNNEKSKPSKRKRTNSIIETSNKKQKQNDKIEEPARKRSLRNREKPKTSVELTKTNLEDDPDPDMEVSDDTESAQSIIPKTPENLSNKKTKLTKQTPNSNKMPKEPKSSKVDSSSIETPKEISYPKDITTDTLNSESKSKRKSSKGKSKTSKNSSESPKDFESETTSKQIPQNPDTESPEPSLRRSSRARKKVNYNDELIFGETTLENSKKSKRNSKKDATEIESENVVEKMELDDYVVEVKEVSKISKATTKSAVICAKPPLIFPESPKKTRPVIDLILDEPTMNSFLSWTEKYQPIKARHVIGDRIKTKEVFNWLCLWKEKHESIVKKLAARVNRKSTKRKGRADSDYSDFDDSSTEESDEEELLSNTMLLTGPVGCGTTSAVVACAKQMDFKILELNPSIYRTGKNVFDLVSEAVASHQIQKSRKKSSALESTSSFGNFFNKDRKLEKKPISHQDTMSLILVEQADVIYEELDKGFWQGITDLRRLAKRPMVLTANDNRILSYLQTDEYQHTERIELSYTTIEQILPNMQLMCLVEGVFVPKSLLTSIIEHCQHDIRKVVMQLHFWFDQGRDPLFKDWKKEENSENTDIIEVVDVDTPKQRKNKKSTKSSDDKTDKSDESAVGSKITEIAIKQNEHSTVENGCVEPMEIIELSDDSQKGDVINNNGAEAVASNRMSNDTVNAVDSNIHDPNSTDKQKPSPLARQTSIQCYPVFKEQVLFQNHKIQSRQFKAKCGCHTFVKPRKTKDVTDLDTMSIISEQLSEVDSLLNPPRKPSSSEFSIPRMSMVDSLSDSLWKERERIFDYPDPIVRDSLHGTVSGCYGDVIKKDFVMDKKEKLRSERYHDLYSGIEDRLPTCTLLDRDNHALLTLPYLKNITHSEEVRKNTQNKRGQRRFLHYLVSNNIIMDDETLLMLQSHSFNDSIAK